MIYMMRNTFFNRFIPRTINPTRRRNLFHFMNFIARLAVLFIAMTQIKFFSLLNIFIFTTIIYLSLTVNIFPTIECFDIRPSFIVWNLFVKWISNCLILIPWITCWKLMRINQYFMNRLPQIIPSIDSWLS